MLRPEVGKMLCDPGTIQNGAGLLVKRDDKLAVGAFIDPDVAHVNFNPE